MWGLQLYRTKLYHKLQQKEKLISVFSLPEPERQKNVAALKKPTEIPPKPDYA